MFDGMSCGQLALSRAGIKYDNYYASEIDKFAMGVTQHNYPDTVQIGDVRRIAEKGLPKIDLLMGGSPCQGFSRSGKGLNFDDPRSALLFQFIKAKDYYEPRHFLLENVVPEKWVEEQITKLMGVEPIRINSNIFSAQNRDRLYWTNIPISPLPEDKEVFFSDIVESGRTYRPKVNCLLATMYKENVKSMVKRKKWSYLVEDEDGNPRKITPLECERAQTVPDNYTATASKTQRYKMLGNGWTVDVIAHILSGIETKGNRKEKENED